MAPLREQLVAVKPAGAVVSQCGLFRYYWWRRWEPALPLLVFVLLNPSTADAERNDPTSSKVCRFAELLGFGAAAIVNLYAYRATDPHELRRAGYPVGPYNDLWTREATAAALGSGGDVCLGWGANARGLERPAAVLKLLREAGARPKVLRATRSGFPEHPLYLPSNCTLRPWPLS